MQRNKSHYLRGPTSPEKKSTISQYFLTTSCVVCGMQTPDKICEKCSSSAQLQISTITLMERLKLWEESHISCVKVSK